LRKQEIAAAQAKAADDTSVALHSRSFSVSRWQIAAVTTPLAIILLVSTGTFALTTDFASDLRASLASISNPARAQLAATSEPLWFDRFTRSVYDAFCPFFTDCEEPTPLDKLFAAPTEKPPLAQPTPARLTLPVQGTSSQAVALNPATSTNRIATPATSATPTPPTPQPPSIASDTPPRTIVERIIERQPVLVESGVSETLLSARLDALARTLRAEFAARPLPSSGVSAPITVIPFAQSQKIDQLANTTLTNPTITGGSISGASLSGITVTTNSLTGIMSASQGGTGHSSFAVGDMFYADSASSLAKLPIGSVGQVLKVSGGRPSWSNDLVGSGGTGAWATTSNDLAIVASDPTDVVIVGGTATSTPGNILEVIGNTLLRNAFTAYDTVTAPRFTATSSVASQLPYASTTAISATTASSSNLVASNSFTFSNITGFLKATAGTVATAAIDLANDVTGILAVNRGGTG